MNKNGIIIGLILALILSGGFFYRFTNFKTSGKENIEQKDTAEKEVGEDKNGHDEHEDSGSVKMTIEMQKQNGVIVELAKKQLLSGVISGTGKVEANADRLAHVSPRISGKIVAVKTTLGARVTAGQILATLDSIELGEALGRYYQSKTKLTLSQSNMERVKNLVEKKIAARKDILQAETDFKTAQSELHTDEDRLSLYGISTSDLNEDSHKRLLLPVRSPINGIITEKHAIVGELADPSKSLYTVADLSSVWVLVDINEKDLDKIHNSQEATVTVGAFPDQKLKGRITYIADLVDESTRTVKARVEVSNPGRKLKPEMFATVELVLPGNTATALAVPEIALQEIDGKKVLFVMTENGMEFEPRQVEPGRTTGGMVEIVSGIKEGERYAVKGSFILKSELKKGELEGDAH